MTMRSKPAVSQQGMALPIVLIMIVCLTFVALGFASLYSRRLTLSTSRVHQYDAQYIAETGLDEYLWILNNESYGVNNFIQQQFNSSSNTYAYAGYNQEANGYYNIVCATPPANPTSLNLTCTGWLASDPTHQYTFTATVQTRSFTNYLYFTQQEIGENGAPVYWRPGDYLHGKLFTNGIIQTVNNSSETPPTPVFYDTVNCWDGGSSSYASDIAGDVSGSGTPALMQGEFLKGASPPNYLPLQASGEYNPPGADSIANLKTVAQAQGLYFTGRTCLYLNKGQYYYDNEATGVKGPFGLPANAVIYVANDGVADPGAIPENNTYDPTAKFNIKDGNVFVSGTLSGQLTIYAENNIYLTAGDPTNQLYGGSAPLPATINGSNSLGFVTYSNTSFNTGSSPTEAIAQSTGGTNDMLGLIAYNYVMILRYGWPDDTSSYGSENVNNDYSPQSGAAVTNVYLDAAIMAVKHGFLYECSWPGGTTAVPYYSSTYCSGNPNLYPVLNITGAIIQNDRGAVAGDYSVELGCGYVKNYWYDSRMQYETPPYFLQPGNSGWGILSWFPVPPSNMTFAPVASVTVPQNGQSVSEGHGLQLSATVTPSNAPSTVTWSFSQTTESTTDSTTGSSIDPYSGLLIAGTNATGTVTVYANTIFPSQQYAATITITH